MAAVTAVYTLFSTALPTAFFLKLFLTRYALSSCVANFLALVTTDKFFFAYFSAAWGGLATQNICEKLLAAVAKPIDDLKARRAGPIVAIK